MWQIYYELDFKIQNEESCRFFEWIDLDIPSYKKTYFFLLYCLGAIPLPSSKVTHFLYTYPLNFTCTMSSINSLASDVDNSVLPFYLDYISQTLTVASEL